MKSAYTPPDTFCDAFMLFELTGKGIGSFPRPLRIEVKPLIRQFTLTVKGLITCLFSTLLRFSCALSPPILSITVLSCLIQSLSTFGRGLRVFQKKFIKREGCTPPDLCNLLKTISKNFFARFFE